LPKIENHAPGTFCWVELATTDPSAAKGFYSELFGWTASDSPIGENEYYTRFRLNGDDVAAAFTLSAEERRVVPPHWHLYVAVESAERAAERTKELGGKVIEPPFDMQSFGRMALRQDPTGAYISVWQGRDHKGISVSHENGTFCWADLSTPDPARARQFYEGLFGWTVGPAPNYPPEYLLIQHGGRPIAGIRPASQRDPNVPPHWALFFLAADVDGAAARAKELGGTVHLGPISMGGARMAVLADPQGAAFSMIRPPASA
jgi:predicted enzyme related to lactoylglutathione lyase